MKGLILKDLYYLKNNLKILLLLLAFYGIFFVRADSYILGIAMASFMIGILAIGTLSVDIQSKWNKYALTMPLSRKTLVGEKFLFVNGSIITIFLILMIVTFAIFGIPVMEDILIAISFLCFFVIFLNLQIFTIYRFGPEKSVIFVFLTIGILFTIGYGIKKLLPEFTDELLETILSFKNITLAIVVLAVTTIFILVMYILSLKHMEKVEF